MKKLFLMLSLILFMACEYKIPDDVLDKYYRLPHSYSTELQKDDTLIFQDQFGQIGKYYIINIRNALFRNSTSETSDSHPYVFNETQTIYIDSVNNTLTPNLIFIQGLDNSVDTFYNKIHYIDFSTDECICISKYSFRTPTFNINWYNIKPKNTDALTSIKILNRKFDNVYTFTIDTAGVNSSSIVKWYYNHAKGIIGFELKNQKVFELTNF